MSYSATICFKTLKEGEVYSFFQQLKSKLNSKFKEIAEDNFLWMPSIRYEHIYGECKDTVQADIDKAWVKNSIFTYRYFYLPEINVLGMFSIPDQVQDLFDASCYFQNSTDQDYSFDEWKGIPAFEAIADKWKNASDKTVMCHYETNYGKWDEEGSCDLDYHRRSFAYDEIWGMCEQYLYNEDNVVYLAVFGHYEDYKIGAFVRMCREQYGKWLQGVRE